MVTTSACHAADAGRTGSIPGTGSCDWGHWGLCIPRESENPVNVGSVSIWDVKEPLRTTSTLAVTILSDSCVSPKLGCFVFGVNNLRTENNTILIASWPWAYNKSALRVHDKHLHKKTFELICT